jgi:predicted nucleotidyltransferase
MNVRTVSPHVLDEIVRRIMRVANPDKIILFGSAARGEMGRHSDLDLLVVKSGCVHRRKLAQEIYKSLLGIGLPVDVLVATPGDLERYKDSIGLTYRIVLQEGEVIYER